MAARYRRAKSQAKTVSDAMQKTNAAAPTAAPSNHTGRTTSDKPREVKRTSVLQVMIMVRRLSISSANAVPRSNNTGALNANSPMAQRASVWPRELRPNQSPKKISPASVTAAITAIPQGNVNTAAVKPIKRQRSARVFR